MEQALLSIPDPPRRKSTRRFLETECTLHRARDRYWLELEPDGAKALNICEGDIIEADFGLRRIRGIVGSKKRIWLSCAVDPDDVSYVKLRRLRRV